MGTKLRGAKLHRRRYSPRLTTLSRCALMAWTRVAKTMRMNAGLKTPSVAL